MNTLAVARPPVRPVAPDFRVHNHEALFSSNIAHHPEPRLLTLYAHLMDHANRVPAEGLERGQYRFRHGDFRYWFPSEQKINDALRWLEDHGYIEVADPADGTLILTLVAPQPWLHL